MEQVSPELLVGGGVHDGVEGGVGVGECQCPQVQRQREAVGSVTQLQRKLTALHLFGPLRDCSFLELANSKPGIDAVFQV